MTFALANELDEGQVAELCALYQREWWTKDRELADVRRMVACSDFVFALTESGSGALAGFARVLTDRVYKALVLDVIVAEPWRGRALGRRLMDAILEHPDLSGVQHFELYCLPELVPFYAQWGFSDELGALRFLRKGR